jgi:putative inorganic carbon (HCO3(-)) transporter
MLRTIFVVALLLIGARYSFKAPFYTLLFYLFISYFRPEEWVWTSFLASANVSYLVGVWVVAYAIISRPKLNVGAWPILLIVFLAHSLVSALMSEVWGFAFQFWQEFAKSILVAYLCVVFIDDEDKLRLALLVIAFSLGFEGAKQGWNTLLRAPGYANANGWPNLGDNNGVAIGMLMLVSLFMALANTSRWKLEQYIERFFLIGVMYRAVSTYSRGGFLSLGALLVYLVLRGKKKVRGVLTIGLALALIVPALPQEFWDRMGTIQTSAQAAQGDTNTEAERSAAGRLHFWEVAVVMGNANPIFGVGPWAFNQMYNRYDFSNGEFGGGRSVHSAWFGLLAETGYVGLGIVVLLLVRSAFVTWRVRRLARKRKDFATLAAYATGLEGALLVVLVGGTFYPFQYMEPLWHTLALMMVIDRLATKRLQMDVDGPVVVPAASPQVKTSVQLPRMTARSRVTS